jgi:hypothetical protein
MSSWSLAAPAPVIALAALFALGAAWLSWTNWRRNGRRAAVGRLECLRFFLVLALVFTLLRPEYVRRIQRVETPEIDVLVDGSDSMKTRDMLETNAVISRAEWTAIQLKRPFWSPLGKKAKVSVATFSAPSTNGNAVNGTDLAGTLEDALRRSRNLKAVLLLTDGQWNVGKSPLGVATQFREQNVPVFSVAVGRESPLPDLALEQVNAPAYGLLGEDMAIPFKVTSHLPREVKTTISLIDDNGEEATRPITIPPNGTVEESILWSPRATGDITAKLKLPVEADEAIAANNEQTFHTAIRAEKLRVLVVDSVPRWEYRYLRNALARDPGVDLRCLLLRPDLGPGAGADYISSFPSTKEALAPFDVVFLGDVGIGEGGLTDRDAELIKGLVEQEGSGLVFVPGRGGREASFLESPLKDLYPVELDAAKPAGVGLQNESQLILTSTGRRHWLTRFDADEDRNDELWKQLPGFFWSASVEKSRPGSEVLAVHSDLRNQWGRMPLLVTRPAGNGKVLFLGTDSAWRWRRGVEDKFHYRFWGQVVRWMAHQRHLSEKDGIRLIYSPETPEAGDSLSLQATVLDPAGFPIDKGQVTGKVTFPGGGTERLDFTQVDGGWGVFKSSFAAPEAGHYKMEIDSVQNGRHLQTDLLVARPQLEKLGEPVNSEVLREIAAITHGASVSMDGLGGLVKQISLLPEPQPMERRVRLWSEPLWGGFIVFLLIVYWVGRKSVGLV